MPFQNKNFSKEEYTMLIDQADSDTLYIGWARIGSGTDESVWQIRRLETVGTVKTYGWADGNDNFDNEWDERATYTYS